MKLEEKGKLLKIYIGESDQYKGQPLYHAIVVEAKKRDLSGATVTRGVEGFGANSRIHTTNILRLSQDLPVTVEIVDSADKINAFLGQLDQMVGEGLLITVDDVTIELYRVTQ